MSPKRHILLPFWTDLVYQISIYLFARSRQNHFVFESHSPHKIELLYFLHVLY